MCLKGTMAGNRVGFDRPRKDPRPVGGGSARHVGPRGAEGIRSGMPADDQPFRIDDDGLANPNCVIDDATASTAASF